jgi:hypothetical protein
VDPKCRQAERDRERGHRGDADHVCVVKPLILSFSPPKRGEGTHEGGFVDPRRRIVANDVYEVFKQHHRILVRESYDCRAHGDRTRPCALA